MKPYGQEKIGHFPGKNGENNAWWYKEVFKILKRGSIKQKNKKTDQRGRK